MSIRVPSRTNQRRYGYVDRAITTLYAGCAEIISPENGEFVTTNTPTFSWAPVEGATSYNFYIWEDGEAEPLPVNTTETSYTPTLEYATTYRWRVNPVNDFGETSGCTFGQDVTPAEGKSASIELTTSSSVSFSSETYTVTAGQNALITVVRQGSSGAASVNYQTADGSASAPTDYTSTSGTLEWADGDSASKQFLVPTSVQAVVLEYSNYVFYAWETGGDDPRNCLNDHEYRYSSSGTWRSTLEAAIADAESALGATIGTMHGWSKVNTEVAPHLSGVDPGELEILALHFNNYIPSRGYFGSLPNVPENPVVGYAQGPDVRGKFFVWPRVTTSGADIWWNGICTPSPDHGLIRWDGIDADGTNKRRLGVYRIGPWWTGTPTWIDRIREVSEARHFDLPNPGDQLYSSGVSLDTLIDVRRKIRAPDDPCSPRCDDQFPDYPPNSNYCVINEQPVRRGGWTLTEGDFKALAIYTKAGAQGTIQTVSQYPLGPVLPSDDGNYSSEAYWTAQYNAAVAAGTTVAGKTYSSTGLGGDNTYPRYIEAAFVRNATPPPGDFSVSLSAPVNTATVNPTSATVTIEP